MKADDAIFRTLLEAAADGIVIVDSGGSICQANPAAAQIFGREAGNLIGSPFGFPIVVGEKTELEIVRGGQKRTVVEMRVTDAEWEGEKAYLAVLRDVTERKTAEEHLVRLTEELARSNRDLEQFAYIISHDLKAPLHTIYGFAQVLSEDYAGRLDETASKHIDHIVKGAARMQRMIEDVLAYSRVGRSGDFGLVEFESVLRQAMENLHTLIEDRGAVITHDPLPATDAIQSLMVMLIQNLLGNAIKFSVEKPRIHITAKREGDSWVFAVRDNGIGIKPEHFDRLFTLFQRLHTEKEYPGTGVGLAVCKKIIERHRGSIWLESELGKGSTFYFKLPAA